MGKKKEPFREPDVGLYMPLRRRKNVVFPEPLGPIRARRSPSLKVSDIFFRIVIDLSDLF